MAAASWWTPTTAGSCCDLVAISKLKLRHKRGPVERPAPSPRLTPRKNSKNIWRTGAAMHTTNYRETLIVPSPDCAASSATIPSKPGTIAALQHERLSAAPYEMTSDEL